MNGSEKVVVYELQPGYAYRRVGKGWQTSEFVVVPDEAVGERRAIHRLVIDDAPCVSFVTKAGLFAQSEARCKRVVPLCSTCRQRPVQAGADATACDVCGVQS